MKNSTAEPLLRSNSSFDFQLSGTSMIPTIHGHDTVHVQQIDPDQLRAGDLLLAVRPDGSLLAHRIIRIFKSSEEFLFRTRGDANPKKKELIPGNRVFGKIVRVRKGNVEVHMNSLLAQAWTLFMLCFSPLVARFYGACAGFVSSG